MQDFVEVTGLILKVTPVGEYDKSVILLTKERGKISAFAKGARKPGNRFCGVANPFTFGTFRLFVGKHSFTILEAEVKNYFEPLRTDFEGAYYGIYFMEIADYYSRENNDERALLKLLYVSLLALTHPSFSHALVRCIFEIKAMVVNGEFPGIPGGDKYEESTCYAVSFIENTPPEKLYTFSVTQKVLTELEQIARITRRRVMNHPFKSLEMVEKFCVENAW